MEFVCREDSVGFGFLVVEEEGRGWAAVGGDEVWFLFLRGGEMGKNRNRGSFLPSYQPTDIHERYDCLINQKKGERISIQSIVNSISEAEVLSVIFILVRKRLIFLKIRKILKKKDICV